MQTRHIANQQMQHFENGALLVICFLSQSIQYVHAVICLLEEIKLQVIKPIPPNSDKYDQLLSLMSNSTCRLILSSIIKKPKSANEISTDCKVSVSTVYRKLDKLVDAKLVKITGKITHDKVKTFLFQSTIESVKTQFSEDVLIVEITKNKELESLGL